MEPVVLINPFEVPAGEEEQFFKVWNAAAEQFRNAPGCISTHLHESLDPKAKFRFVNVAQWETPEHYLQAMKSEAVQKLRASTSLTFYPALYRVIHAEETRS